MGIYPPGAPNSAKFRGGRLGWPRFDKGGGGGGVAIIFQLLRDKNIHILSFYDKRLKKTYMILKMYAKRSTF